MEIELERGGSSVTCYYCAFENADQRTPPGDTDIDWNDPRLACGSFGSTNVIDGLKSRPEYWALGEYDDYQLRAVITMSYSDSHVNAEELISGYNEVLDGLVNGTGGAGMIDAQGLWHKMLSQGGYFPVAANATNADQSFAIELGLYGLQPFMSVDGYNMLSSNLDYLWPQWQDAINQGQNNQTFADYLISQGALNWF